MHVSILILAVEEHDVGVDDVNETLSINDLNREFSGKSLIGKADLSVWQDICYLHIFFT